MHCLCQDAGCLIVPNRNNCTNCLWKEIKLTVLASSVGVALRGRSHQGFWKGHDGSASCRGPSIVEMARQPLGRGGGVCGGSL